jgi:hypothetical protein
MCTSMAGARFTGRCAEKLSVTGESPSASAKAIRQISARASLQAVQLKTQFARGADLTMPESQPNGPRILTNIYR